MSDPRVVGGVLRVDKPVGPTSHDVVAIARRALGTRRIGHTGTLDPFASGLLLLCVGPATRIAEYLSALPKTYRATLRLGSKTDTDDLTGSVLSQTEGWDAITREELLAALREQTGAIQQLPPLYSAKRVEGERMHAVARRGGVVERTPVPVTIYRNELLSYDPPDAEIEVECSSGTYIRAIARDVGESLGVGGHLRALRRTRVGPHSVEDAVPLDALAGLTDDSPAWITPAAALAHLPQLTVDEAGAAALRHGRAVEHSEPLQSGATVVLCAPGGELLALAEAGEGVLKPRKVFA
jgi:tRNA pseudouridine55 synthase